MEGSAALHSLFIYWVLTLWHFSKTAHWLKKTMGVNKSHRNLIQVVLKASGDHVPPHRDFLRLYSRFTRIYYLWAALLMFNETLSFFIWNLIYRWPASHCVPCGDWTSQPGPVDRNKPHPDIHQNKQNGWFEEDVRATKGQCSASRLKISNLNSRSATHFRYSAAQPYFPRKTQTTFFVECVIVTSELPSACIWRCARLTNC